MEIRNTYQLGLIGWPVEHSLSPKLHQAALASAGLNGDYHLYPVENGSDCEANLQRLVGLIRSGEIHGLNVTIPHKQNVLPLMDELTAAARTIGAVNTIYYRDGKVVGDNTDAAGFLHDLRNHQMIPDLSADKKALVLGAGGSARAVVHAVATDGWSVVVGSRRDEQAADLARSISGSSNQVAAYPLEKAIHAGYYYLVVNCTPLGMDPHPQASPWPEDVAYPVGACFYDLVYAPRETRLVREALQAGHIAANGLGMLIEQAALAFERWTGCPADRAVMKAAVE